MHSPFDFSLTQILLLQASSLGLKESEDLIRPFFFTLKNTTLRHPKDLRKGWEQDSTSDLTQKKETDTQRNKDKL